MTRPLLARAARSLAIVGVLGLISVRPAAATALTYSTIGCFAETSCSTLITSPTLGGLTFTGVTNITTADLVAPVLPPDSDIYLGTFSIPSSGNVMPFPDEEGFFTLGLNFTVPTSTLPVGGSSTYTAAVKGKIAGNSGNHDSILIEFANTPINFAFDADGVKGAFSLYILNDPTLSRDATSVNLTGRIETFSYDPLASTATAPEPASLVLLGTGLLVVAARARRKHG